MSEFRRFHRLKDYYPGEIQLDTAHDARHLLSVFTAFCPDISVEFHEDSYLVRNITNNQGNPILVKWRLQV